MNGRDRKGRSPLIIATSRGHTELCSLLLKAGGDRCLADYSGRTALGTARARGHNETAAVIENHLVVRLIRTVQAVCRAWPGSRRPRRSRRTASALRCARRGSV